MIKFQKYQACGNNFIIIEDQFYQNDDYQKLAISMCDYSLGIGADGLIIVKKDPLEMVFYNQDGTRGKMCGNGIRCFSKYVLDNIYTDLKKLEIVTLAGMIYINVINDNPLLLEVNMGKPSYHYSDIGLKSEYNLIEKINYNNQQYTLYNLFMGVTHTVVIVDNLEEIIKTSLGEYICYHDMFIDRTNVDFVEIINQDIIKMKTYERGVGWTKACSTGASASYVTLRNLNLINEEIKVLFELDQITIKSENDFIIIYAGAKRICTGIYGIEK